MKRIDSDEELLKIRRKSISKCPYCSGKQLSDLSDSPDWRIGHVDRDFPGAEGDMSIIRRYINSPNAIRYIQCKQCEGFWLDIYEVRNLELPPQMNDSDAIKRTMKNPEVCPFCRSKRPVVEKFNVSMSGVNLDVFCPNCSATWIEKAVLVASIRIDSPVEEEGVVYADDLPDEEGFETSVEDLDNQDETPEETESGDEIFDNEPNIEINRNPSMLASQKGL